MSELHRVRSRRKVQPPPTQCPVLLFKGRQLCGREKRADELVCSACAQTIVYGESGKTWFQLWIMEFMGESARRSALADARARRSQAEERRKSETPMLDVVYYVRTAPGRVKIGTTGDLARRLREYRSDASYLLAVEPGGRDLEQQRHAELKKWRVNRRREDYAEGPEVIARIHAVVAEHGDPGDFLQRLEAS